jgi:endonuclease YncB( thermonuclease family)
MRDQWGRRRGLADWSRSRPTAVAVLAAVLAGGITWLLTGDDHFTVETGQTSSEARVPTTLPTVASTTSSLPPTTVPATQRIPAGDDATVTRVIDGDSFAIEGGTGIRLIGVNAPEVELDECYSDEATQALGRLLPAGTRVRIAYDQERLDRFGRTLAYVYRLSDGLFVNLTLASDGFAREMATAPNLSHADDFREATTEARMGNRGLWAACATSTTSSSTTSTTRSTTTSTTSTTRP